jgi:ribosome-binding protein aMBF1 (putative translation factor)
MIEAEIVLQLAIMLFDRPAAAGERDEVDERRRLRQVEQVVLPLVSRGSFAEQPPVAAAGRRPDAQRTEPRGQCVEDVRVQFGRRVRELRKARGFPQEELAHRAGIHYTYIGGIERGERNPALVNINRIAAALGVPLAELFSVFVGKRVSVRKV